MENIYKYYPNRLSYPENNHLARYATVPSSNMVYVNRNMVTSLQSTVLVNPKFNRHVHVNPNFANNANKVYVNPNVFSKTNPTRIPNTNWTTPADIRTSSIFATKYSKINNIVRPMEKSQLPARNDRIVKTKTKLIRIPANKAAANVPQAKNDKIPFGTRNQLPLKTNRIVTRHKLIKIVQSPSTLHKKMSYTKQKSLVMIANNRFKLDNRQPPATLTKSRYKLTKKAYMMRLDPRNTIIKKSAFKLVRSTQKQVKNAKSTCKRTAIKLRKSFKKINIPCEVYNRHGFCRLQTMGKCQKKHNPNQIQICIWFLQGQCLNGKCRLSHKVSLEKMPTCKFYLEGMCRKEDCPYAHVKLSKDAPICREFLNGFCPNGLECNQRHQFLCPDFERDGNCRKRLCRYPHGRAVRAYTKRFLTVFARQRKSKVIGIEEGKRKRAVKSVALQEVNEESDVKRYYDCANVEQSSSDDKTANNGDVERPKLGALPSFISI